MDLKEIGINTRNWVDSTQDRDYWRALVNAALNSISHGVSYEVGEGKQRIDEVRENERRGVWSFQVGMPV